MMGQITIGQLMMVLASTAGVVGSLTVVYKFVTFLIDKVQERRKEREINPILNEMARMEARIMGKMAENDAELNNKIDNLTQEVNNLDISECKDIIVSFIAAIEDDASIDTAFEQRAYEAMERYTNVLYQNSYIHKRWVEVVEKKYEVRK